MANHRQIVRCMVFSDSGMVFIEGYIKAIMQTILDSPMLSHGTGEGIHAFQRSNGIAKLEGFRFALRYARTDHTNSCQT